MWGIRFPHELVDAPNPVFEYDLQKVRGSPHLQDYGAIRLP